jgi:RNA polymerase sigma-70 factor (ECF subfamily)
MEYSDSDQSVVDGRVPARLGFVVVGSSVFSTPAGICAAGLQSEVLDLYQRHSSCLLQYAASMVRDQEEARDAVQEAYLRYFVQRKYGRQIDNPRVWLYQVLHNYLLDRFKAMARKMEVSLDDLEYLADQGHNPEKLLQCRELAAEIAATLTGRELHCLRLRAGGLGYEEIADAMDVRPGTVGALLARVHRKLGRCHQEWMTTGPADLCSLLVEGQANSS